MRRASIAPLLITLAAACGSASAADRALVVGLDKHADSRLDARLGTPAANDVQAVKELLLTKLGYTGDNIRVLADEAATAAAIRENLASWLVAGTKAGDRVYFYFAGHGYFTPDTSGDEADGLDEGFVPFDAKLSEEGGRLAIDGLVLDDEIADMLKALQGRQVTLVVDAGFSGKVTRTPTNEAQDALFRAPVLASANRAIVVEAKAAAQKQEGGWVDATPEGLELAVWTAVSASQTAMLDPVRTGSGGIFTSLYLEALKDGKADANGNGQISNPELLAYLTEGSLTYCATRTDACQMGLTPRLEPALAHGLAALAGADKTDDSSKLTISTVQDFLAKGNVTGVALTQTPEGPVHVGDKDIRFHVLSPHDGFLILLNLTDDGELFQLFPNQFSRKKNGDGQIRANSVLMVPDDYYGLRFNATAPSSGQIIAVVARRKVDWEKAVGTRAIEVIPRQEAVKTFLPQIAAALGNPVANSNPNENTQPMEWSVATMRYEIKPR
jgi:hypothetical protein